MNVNADLAIHCGHLKRVNVMIVGARNGGTL